MSTTNADAADAQTGAASADNGGTSDEGGIDTAPDIAKVCTSGVLGCADPRTSSVCNADGSGFDTTACDQGLTCWPDSGKCKLPNCEPEERECRGLDTYRVCGEYGIQWGDTLDCPANTACDGGVCVGCTAGTLECLSDLTFRQCAADGSAWSEEAACGDGMACFAEQCCTSESVCDADGKAAKKCVASDGTVLQDELQTCTQGTQCWSGTCVSCIPGSTQCSGDTGYQECTASGLGYGVALPCDGTDVCVGGACTADGCLPRVLLVVDRSGSMSGSWGDVAASITTLSTSNPGYYGLIAFPGNADSCGAPDELDVPMALDNSLALQQWMSSHAPTGATPLLAVMEKLQWLAPTALEGDPGTLVVLSDGDDSCASGNISTKLGTAASTLFNQYKIVTYAIGYQYGSTSSSELNALTAGGGSGQTTHINAGSEAELTDAFQGIINDIKYCD